ncbi:putative glycolipid-binding domain-containing protein [Thalassococcus sp. BH17M4-6]|uniref:putative glycolipid-binding domain-containing protein n=1 Tax=Thalassococcus sp. BH17M4-6 TaxID=3413148 RepID=UPI003BE9EDD3
MTTDTVATVHWRALDRMGEDTCRLTRLDTGWMLVGHARFSEGGSWSALDYVVRCDGDWGTTSADITGLHDDEKVALHVLHLGRDWTVNGTPQPQLDGAIDIDLGFTPATNLMPLRRLPDVGRMPVRAAWLRDPASPLEPLDQTYTRARGGLVQYHSVQTGYETHLKVDAHGFVTHYPDLWELAHAP